MTGNAASPLETTPLDKLHRELGGRMVPFAGTSLPLQYPSGILSEHAHTRASASLFDVSHMGQFFLHDAGADDTLTSLVPADVAGLKGGQVVYTLLTNGHGGIIDDLMLSRCGNSFFMIVNAARKQVDFEHIKRNLKGHTKLEDCTTRALLALQGPKACDVLQRFIPAVRHLVFMSANLLHLNDIPCFVSRTGYTGEDGFEISLPAESADHVARLLLGEDEVEPAGLGARDTLRLEAGLCLYGNDIDETTTIAEAGLMWTVPKSRRAEGDFPGWRSLVRELDAGPARRRVGLKISGRTPARAGAEITTTKGAPLGHVTSGGFGPTVGGPVAMGYVATEASLPGTEVRVVVRGKAHAAEIVKLPFVPRGYVRE